ncbi:MAG TPA: hypothetical protein VM285_13200 [Polyangia bacterium]|nr:hypothetical protein [Polyangia bacterium]
MDTETVIHCLRALGPLLAGGDGGSRGVDPGGDADGGVAVNPVEIDVLAVLRDL